MESIAASAGAGASAFVECIADKSAAAVSASSGGAPSVVAVGGCLVCLFFTVVRRLPEYNEGELRFFQVFDHPQGVAGLVIGVVLQFIHEIAHDEQAIAAALHLAQVVLDIRRTVVGKIEALPMILQLFPLARYVIVGTGPEENKLKEMVRQAGLHEYVLFTGEIDNNELACWYEICDIFVMPHRNIPTSRDTEGCPTVFLEASAHGKPVIGGKDGGVADAILHDRTGFIIDGTDARELAESVCYLLKTPDLAVRMGSAGRVYVATLGLESRAAAIQQINIRLTEGNCAVART